MNRRISPRFAITAVLSVALCACHSTPETPSGYFGPTLPLDQLVQQINRNNAAVPTLWARAYFEATIIDPKDKSSHFVNGDGNLQYSSPSSMRLEVSKELADLFAMGSDGSNYWLWQKNDGIFWWGSFANIAKPGAESIPIRPDLVLEVLGIRPLDPVLLDEPAPVMRFNSDSDVYMIVWQSRASDHWAAQKEIWYDRATLRPTKVILFNAAGRVVLRASLSDYAPLKISDAAKDQSPTLAMRYLLFFPESGSHMSLTLRDAALSHNGFPKPAIFHMPDPDTLAKSGVKVHAIDEGNSH